MSMSKAQLVFSYEISDLFCIIIYCMSALSLHTESTNSTINIFYQEENLYFTSQYNHCAATLLDKCDNI